MQMLSAKDVAQKLVEINAIKLNPDNPFKWASGLYSPIYCDNRTILSYPSFRTEIKKSLAMKASELGAFNKIAGVATAGIAHGALIADELDLPFIYIRSNAKSHGTRSQIEGVIHPDDQCLVVEDLISTGGSSIAAVEVLRSQNIAVTGVLAIFNYAFDRAEQNFKDADCSYATLSNYHALIEVIKESNTWTKDQVNSLIQWRQNPIEWSSKFE
jgi:orotate phosphoribosyltransferase